MGMAHRGRLNTLTNIFEKPVHDILSEFQGKEFDSVDGFYQFYTKKIPLAVRKNFCKNSLIC